MLPLAVVIGIAVIAHYSSYGAWSTQSTLPRPCHAMHCGTSRFRSYEYHCHRWQVPRSQPDGLAGALSVLEARRALWESIGAWEDLVAEWRSTLFEELDIHAAVPITRHPFLCLVMPLMRVPILRVSVW